MQTKVIHVITTIQRGGAENQLLILINEQIRVGFDVEVIFLKGIPELLMDITEVGGRVNQTIANVAFWKQVWRLRRQYRGGVGIVHAHLPKSELAVALALPRKSFVFTRHNAEKFWPHGPKLLSILLSRFVSSRAKSGIAISNAVKKYLVLNSEIVKTCPVRVVHYGFAQTHKTNIGSKIEFREKFRSGPEIVVLGAIGRLVPQKDFRTMILGFAEAHKRLPNLRLFIVGEGYLKPELLTLVSRLNLVGKVTFLGRTKYINEFLEEIDVFILSSIYEGLGMVLLEACALSKPILAANNTAIPEVLGKHYPGLFPTKDFETLALKIVAIHSVEFQKELSGLSKARSLLFDAKTMCSRVTTIYNETD